MTTTTISSTAAQPDQDNTGSAGPDGGQHQQAAQQAVDANSTHLHFQLGDTVVDMTLPPVDRLACYAGLTGAAAFGLIEWPIAALTGLGHLLSDDRRNRALRALGEALDGAV